LILLKDKMFFIEYKDIILFVKIILSLYKIFIAIIKSIIIKTKYYTK